MINIEGLSRAKVLAALYNNSQPQGFGFLQFVPEDMTESQAQVLLNDCAPCCYFDYVLGRVMKVDLSDHKEFNERLYDRDNGEGAALAVINKLREEETNV